MKFLSVDRIEKNHIICEDENGEVHDIPVKNLDKDIKEGSVVSLNNKGEVKIDQQKTNIRKNIILKLRRKIYGADKNPKIDF